MEIIPYYQMDGAGPHKKIFLPVDNDTEKGGRIVKIRMDRAGRMTTAKKDSHEEFTRMTNLTLTRNFH